MGTDLVRPSGLRFQLEYSMVVLARQDTPARDRVLTTLAPRLGDQHAWPPTFFNLHKWLVEDARITLGQAAAGNGEIGFAGATGGELI